MGIAHVLFSRASVDAAATEAQHRRENRPALRVPESDVVWRLCIALQMVAVMVERRELGNRLQALLVLSCRLLACTLLHGWPGALCSCAAYCSDHRSRLATSGSARA